MREKKLLINSFLYFWGSLGKGVASIVVVFMASFYVSPSDMGIYDLVISTITLLQPICICITKISTFLILCDLAVCLATLYVSFSLVFALMRYLQGKVFLIRFYSPTTLSSSRAEFRLPSRLACA